jgi:hypothetical protein
MAEITDFIAQTGGLQSMANELGISESQATAGAAAFRPSLADSRSRRNHSLRD